ncbi:hypothetical protein RO3G_05340 [Rhizopus delemar RA 99-880]|uniref:RNA-directed DNA polymerase n=1 Tax=Rhizopus delemar (strain RA 99-880 / ATCC MYA-4621 / FGSC 9543 / NRRL 43880) TaxID=246409 RepID=I1BWQ5_RHIO9|nr:hypothetical protein RO3G_05340 [Rhizopus delemar RA 99-880]|eukprot:EIE80635.1 hypothetical protein RO3G_05340 [Rhizopus delemar RA 99-880]
MAAACRPVRIPVEVTNPGETMAVIEDEDINTTAVYSKVNIGDKFIKALIDCGAAKTCMSKALADTLGLYIDAASESIFTLGNGTKQPALGIIYDAPICVKDNMIIPCTVEVLPSCPNPLIIGNNWLNRAKAKIDFNSSTLKVAYKNKKAELEISFLRKNTTLPKVSSYTQKYEHPISLTNSKETKHVRFEAETQDDDDSTDQDEESEESSDESVEEELEDEEDESLLLLENDKDDDIKILNQGNDMLLKAPSHGLTIATNTSKTIWVRKSKNELKNMIYNLEITNLKVMDAMGYFDSCLNLVTNRKSIEIRIYNRSSNDILLDPDEEIGIIEKINPQEDSIIQAYNVDTNPHLYVMEMSESNNTEKNEEGMLLESDKYKKIEIGEISQDIKRGLQKLLKKYESIFDWDNNTIGYTNLIKHKITIKEDTMPISHRPYRMSPIETEHLQKELDKYCKLGVIAPSNSPWAAPVILVKKKNGEYRMVIDYRKLNAVTKKDAYPLPRIDDLLDTLGKAKVFSALDMRAGFHQVPLEEDSKELTAFTTKFGTYHYNTLPMGLNKCFNASKLQISKLNPEKCFFFKDHLKFLGYIVTKEGLQTDPSKIQKIVEYPQPRTIKQVRGFLGIASYYRRFIKNFAAIARPLHDQTKTTKKIPWTSLTTESFETLKKLLTTAPILSRPDFNKPFILVTDASKLGLGAILTQLDENGHEHPIVYASRGLKSTESNYAPTKLECLAVIWAVKLFRPYLLGKKFTVITDHSALNGLLKTPNPTGIIARWITILSEYEFEVKYRPGRVNESADFLSRLGY